MAMCGRERIVWLVVISAFIGRAARAQPSPGEPEPITYRAVYPLQLLRARQLPLLELKAVQMELGLSEEQKQRQASIVEQYEAKLKAARELTNRDDARTALQKARQDLDVALAENLQPAQRNRLEQIELQAQGPQAFLWDKLPPRLGLSDEQLAAARTTAEKGVRAILKATLMPLPPEIEPPHDLDSVQAFVASKEFQASKIKAQANTLEALAVASKQIAETLTDSQRLKYQELLGAPFDLLKVLAEGDGPDDAVSVAASLGLLGQRADPDFDVSVARPAYRETLPAVLFDEGHHNFHTAGGRYKAFANLITNDGYRVSARRDLFTPELLAGQQVLVIANAMVPRGAGESAFSEGECDAVEQWVKDGGALLLITDHEPFGSASAALAKRFGVEMSKKVASDPANSTADGPLLFSRAKGLIGDHPVTNGRDDTERVNRVLTFTGQSLKGPPESIAFLRFADTATDSDGESEVSAAGRAQGLALSFGKGRVVVLGEAAQLSAQVYGLRPERMGMNVPGCDNRQMALNIMHWLSGLIR